MMLACVPSRARRPSRRAAVLAGLASISMAAWGCASAPPEQAPQGSTDGVGAGSVPASSVGDASEAVAASGAASSMSPAASATTQLASVSAPSASASAPAASASASARVHGPKLPARSTSPGVIDCEDVTCDVATQTCCVEWEKGPAPERFGRCAARAAGCGTSEAIWKTCDETPDCGTGERCCYVPAPDVGEYAQNVCHAGRCEDPEFETCLAESRCKNGKKCRTEPGASTGYCL